MASRVGQFFRRHAFGLIAIFIALGGTAYALQANSVRSNHIVNGQVRPADVSLGVNFQPAGLPGESEAINNCFVPGHTFYRGQWVSWDSTAIEPTGYGRDRFGFVHLKGLARNCGASSTVVFTLPPGFRPEKYVHLNASYEQNDAHFPGVVRVSATGEVDARQGGGAGNPKSVSLEGLSFRCAPSGANGCP